MLPGMELMNCPEMAVPKEVMQHVVRVESSFNPYAIGVVGGHLERQPKSLPEALSTVRMLERRGFNFSVGLAQVNRYNLGKYGLKSYAHAFEACPNLQAGSRILAECHQRHRDWGKSFSCYYSGNAVTGYRHGYVQKVFASIAQERRSTAADSADEGIAVVSKPSRRSVPVDHFPLRHDERTVVSPSRAVPVDAEASPAAISDPAYVGAATPEPTGHPAAPMAMQPSLQHQAATPTSASPPPNALPDSLVVAPVPTRDGPVRLQPMQTPTPARPLMPTQRGDDAFVF